jgi:hypothetical protein
MTGENKKRSPGRQNHSGVLSGINPRSETWSDIRNRIIYGHSEWRMVRLRQLIGDGSKLADNFLDWLSAHAAELIAARDKRYKAKTGKSYEPKEPDDIIEVAWLWRELAAQFQRAVLNGDDDWFARQATAIKDGGIPQRVQFNTAVIRQLEHAMWGTRAKQRAKQEKNVERWKEAQKKQQIEWEQYLKSPEGRAANQHQRQAKWAALGQSQKAKPHVESQTLTPAGKFTDAMASDIYNALEKREVWIRKGRAEVRRLIVEGYQFASKERVMESIHKLAEQLQFALKKQPRRKGRTDSQSVAIR